MFSKDIYQVFAVTKVGVPGVVRRNFLNVGIRWALADRHGNSNLVTRYGLIFYFEFLIFHTNKKTSFNLQINYLRKCSLVILSGSLLLTLDITFFYSLNPN